VKPNDSRTLLADYAETGSEAAFQQLVAGYVDLVYSTALRWVHGDSHLAQDITQTVFLDLARLARTLPPNVMLGGWLHRHTCFTAAKTLRGERRRQSRERHALDMNAPDDHAQAALARLSPVLDEAINQLGALDRTAILLRFFEQQDLRSVGEAIGANEDAARKRVARALDKLHSFLKRRDATLSAAALGTLLAAESVKAAPAGLAGNIAGTVLAASTAATATTTTLFKLLTMAKIKTGILGAVIAGSVATSLILQHQAQASLRDDNELLYQRREQLDQLQAQNSRLSNLLAQAAAPVANSQLDDLLRLRAEAAALRARTNDLATLQAENRRLRTPSLAQNRPKTPLEQKEEADAKMNFARQWMLAFYLYAGDNHNQFPTNFDQAASYLGDKASAQTNVTANQFEIVYQGSQDALTNAANTICLREKQAVQTLDGGWMKAYAFADGHVEIHKETDGNFDPWEQQRLVPPPSQ
jgi:RNA polymerase sigma factor (sigma-70 family)